MATKTPARRKKETLVTDTLDISVADMGSIKGSLCAQLRRKFPNWLHTLACHY